MKTVWILGLSAALAMAGSTSLMAFQEQQGGAPVSAPPAQAAPAPESEPKLGLEQGDAAKASEGTEVRIPGVGKIGVLPKMDFGLELLYGAAEKQPDLQEEATPEDLTIRGSLKHKF